MKNLRVKSAEDQVTGSEEGAEQTHDDEEDQEVIPNFEIDDDNGDPGGLDSENEHDNEMTEDVVLQTAVT